jgi:O-antigen ligase
MRIIKSYLKIGHLTTKIMAFMPFLFFFPVGLMYLWLALLLLTWIAGGNFQAKRLAAFKNPLFYPALLMVCVIFLNAIYFSQQKVVNWSSLVHYLIFIFLIFFTSLGAGEWQRYAKNFFIVGALYGASIFYAAYLNLVPDWQIFKNYLTYTGNKSISLGIFLSVAAAWLLNDTMQQIDKRRIWLGASGYLYMSVAILFLATTRTGMLLFFILSLLVVVRHLTLSWNSLVIVAAMIFISVFAWQFSPHLHERAVATFQALQVFSAGSMSTGQGNRLQFVQKTSEMIIEKPWLGHGVGSWLQQYPERAKGLETSGMKTPHNDYLLYTAELGVVGLAALLCFFAAMLRAALRMGKANGMQLMVIGVAFVIGSALNAILRDWKFGLPMVILLAIALQADGTDDANAELPESSQELSPSNHQ